MSYYVCLSIVQSMINKVTITILDKEDTMLWNHSHDGHLSFKDAYDFHGDLDQNISWPKLIWHIAIPLPLTNLSFFGEAYMISYLLMKL